MRWPLPWPKAWRAKEPAEAEAVEGDEEEKPVTFRQATLLFARDLLVAFLAVLIVMGALFAYTQVWPPMVVVESSSMQHTTDTSFVGVIDTGDLVLVQSVRRPSDVVTFVEGRLAGHETYSNYGDVIVFKRPSGSAETPIIHRAIVYIVANGTGFDVPSLAAPSNGEWSGVRTSGEAATTPYGLRSVTIRGVRNWASGSAMEIDLNYSTNGVAVRTGFLTKGDHVGGSTFDSWGPVPVANIVGKARGELPWFGLLKLTFFPGESGCCPNGWGDTNPATGAPKNSWDSLLVSLIAIIVGPFAADYGWAYWRKRRKARLASRAREEAAGNPDEELPEPPTDESRKESSGPGAGGP